MTQVGASRDASRRELTDFEQVLLAVICHHAASGYDLKRELATGPLGVYQPSSGALYPALRRLEGRGLLRAQHSAGRESGRTRRLLEPTPRGRAEHLRWLRQPVEAENVGRDLHLHLMRFVMMEGQLSDEEILAFLHSLRKALTQFTSELVHFRTSAPLPGRHPRLALDHGADIHRASLKWVKRTIAELDKARQYTDTSLDMKRGDRPRRLRGRPK